MAKTFGHDAITRAIAKLGVVQSPGSSVHQGWTYNPIPFDGCDLFPCHRREASIARWNMIDSAVQDWTDRWVLDMGCATGYFSFSAMKKGAIVLGVEKDPAAREVCETIHRTYKGHYNLQGTFIDHLAAIPPYMSYIFALNVLNWMGKESAEKFLRSTQPGQVIFLEMPLRGDGMRGAQWLASDEELIAWLKDLGLSAKALIRTRGPGGYDRTTYECAKTF